MTIIEIAVAPSLVISNQSPHQIYQHNPNSTSTLLGQAVAVAGLNIFFKTL